MSCREGIRFPSRNLPGSAEKWGRFVEETLRDLSSGQDRWSTNFLNVDRSLGGVHALSAKQLEEIAFAESLANEAQLSADGKSTVWRSPNEPEGTDHKVGDTWFDESDGNKIYTWDGEKWVEAVLGKEALSEQINDTLQEAIDEATAARSEAMAALSRGVNMYPDPSFEYNGAGLIVSPRWEIVQSSSAQQGDHVLRVLANTSGVAGQPTVFDSISSGVPIRGEVWVKRTSTAQTGTASIRVQYQTDAGTSPATNIASVSLPTLTVGQWTQIAGNWETPAGTVGVRFYPYVSDNAEGVEFDSVYAGRNVDIQEALDAVSDLEDELGPRITTAQQDADAAAQEAAQAKQDALTAINTSDTAAQEAQGAKDQALNAMNNALEALTTANEAQASADGKNTIHYGSTAPSGTDHAVGDTWFDGSNDNEIHEWDGSAWVPVVIGVGALDQQIKDDLDSAINTASEALDTAVDAQTSADGKNTIHYGNSAPVGTDHKVGDTWFDGSNGNRINEWDGSDWVPKYVDSEAISTAVNDKIDEAFNTAVDVADEQVVIGRTVDGLNRTFTSVNSPGTGYVGHENLAPPIVGSGSWAEVRRNLCTWTRNVPSWTMGGGTSLTETTDPRFKAGVAIKEQIGATGSWFVFNPSITVEAGETLTLSYKYADLPEGITTPAADFGGGNPPPGPTTTGLIDHGDGSFTTWSTRTFDEGGTFNFSGTKVTGIGQTFLIGDPLIEKSPVFEPFFDGSTSPATAEGIVQPEDFRWRWLGTPNASESVMEAERIASPPATMQNGINFLSTKFGTPNSMRMRGTHPTSTDTSSVIATMSTTLEAGKTYSYVLKSHLEEDRARGARVQAVGNTVAGWTGSTTIINDYGPATAGTREHRGQFTIPADFTWLNFRIHGNVAAGEPDIWYSDINLFEGTLPEDAQRLHNGDQWFRLEEIGGELLHVETLVWNGQDWVPHKMHVDSIAATNSISADKVIFNEGFADKFWANEFNAGKITAGSAVIANGAITNAKIANLDASKISTGEIDADRIGANSITTSKLLVTNLNNLVEDPGFESTGVQAWSTFGSASISTSNPRSGSRSLQVRAQTAAYVAARQINWFAVEPGEEYRVSAWVRSTGASVSNGITLRFRYASTPTGSGSSAPDAATTPAGSGQTYTRISGVWKVPNYTTARFAYLDVVLRDTTTNRTYHVDDVEVTRMTSGELIVDGAITADSAIIANGAIGTAQIANLAVDTANIATGAITNAKIANLDAAKINTGTLNANRIGANSIDTTKLLIQGANLVPNPTFETLTGWTVGGGLNPTLTTTTRGRAVYFGRSVNGERTLTSQEIYVAGQTTYTVGGLVLHQTGSPIPEIRLEVIPVNSSGVDQTPVVVATHGGSSTQWTSIYGQYTVPTSTYRSIRFRFVAGATTATSGNDYLVQPRIVQAAVGEMIVDGSITGDKVNANSVAAKIGEFVEVRGSNIIGDTGSMNQAFIGQLVGDQAFVTSLYANRVIVDAADLAPGVGGYESVWDFQGSATTVTSIDPSGRAISLPIVSSNASNAYGPVVPVREGAKINYELYALAQSPSADMNCRIRFYDSAMGLLENIVVQRVSSSGWVREEVTPPSGTRYAMVGFATFTTSSPAGNWVVRNFNIRPLVGSVLIENGAITGDKVNATSVAAKIGEFIEVRASNIIGDTGAMNQAFIGQLVGDSGFLSSLYANRIVVDAQDFAPGPGGGYSSAYELGADAFYANNTNDPTGGAIFIRTTGSSAARRMAWGPSTPIQEGEWITWENYTSPNVSGSTGATGTNWSTCVYWYQSDGTAASTQRTFITTESGSGGTAGWSRGTVQAPAGTAYARVRFYSASGSTGSWYFRNFTIKKQVGAVLIEDGAITADKLKANAIEAGSAVIAESAITNAMIANLDAAKINTGTLNANRIAANSISAAKISGGSFSGKTFTGGTFTGSRIRTASSGQRLELSVDGFEAFNESGTRTASLSSYSGGFDISHEGGASAISLGRYIGGGLEPSLWSRVGQLGSNNYAAAYMKANESEFSYSRSAGLTLEGRNPGHTFNTKVSLFLQTADTLESSTGLLSGAVGEFEISAYRRLIIDANRRTDFRYQGFNQLSIGYDNGYFIQSTAAHGRTYSLASNMAISSSGTIGRSTSARRYKLDEQVVDAQDYEDSLLSIDFKSWIDKRQSEEMEKLAAYREENPYAPVPPQFADLESFDEPIRHIGAVSEDFVDAGLPEFVIYNDKGEPDGLQYDRIGPALIPIIRRLKDRVDQLESQLDMIQ